MAVDSIDQLDIGTSDAGVTEYIEALHLDIQAVKKVMETELTGEDGVIPTVQEMWVGQSEKKFETDLLATQTTVEDKIEQEYNDLKERIRDVEAYYYNQDKLMGGD